MTNRESVAKFRREHPERWKEIQRKWIESHREQVREYQRNYKRAYRARLKQEKETQA